MFGGPLSGRDVQAPQQPEPYGFEQALGDLIDFLGMGGTEQATANQLANEQEAEAQGVSPYQPRESANVLDRRDESPDMQEAISRFGSPGIGGGEADPKRAAARISLMPRGVVPFVSAAYDVATGQNNPRGLDLAGLYRKRQAEANMLQADQAPASQAVSEYLPYAIGPAIGALAPSKAGTAMGRVIGTAERGAVGGAIMGGLDAYFAPRNDGREFTDPERLRETGKGVLLGAGMGATTAAATRGLIDAGKERFMPAPQRTQNVTRAQPAPQVEPPAERPIGANWGRPTGTELATDAFEKRYSREAGRIAKQLGMSREELQQRVNVSRAGGDFNAPLQPKQAGLAAATNRPEKPPVSQPKPEQAIEAPKQSAAPEPAKQPAKMSREAIRMRAALRGQTPEGRRIRGEVEEKTRLAQIRSDAIVMGNERRPVRELTGRGGNIRTGPENQPDTVQFTAPRERGLYTPKTKRGIMQISEDITSSSGRSPSKWTADDKAKFVADAAKYTNLSPSKIKGLLTSYGEGPRAKRGMSNAEIRKLVEDARMKARTEK